MKSVFVKVALHPHLAAELERDAMARSRTVSLQLAALVEERYSPATGARATPFLERVREIQKERGCGTISAQKQAERERGW